MKKVKPDGIFGGRNKVFFDAEGNYLKYFRQSYYSRRKKKVRDFGRVRRSLVKG